MVATLLAGSGCRNAVEMVPVSPVELRAAMQYAELRPSVPIRDERGRHHEVYTHSALIRRRVDTERREWVLSSLSAQCRPPRECPLDEADARWEIAATKRVADGAAIATYTAATLVVGGLVAGNIACFGTHACGDGSKVFVGVTDGAVALGFFSIVYAASHIGD